MGWMVLSVSATVKTERLISCSCYPKPALHSPLFLVLPPRAVQWKVNNFLGPGLFSCFNGSDKKLVRWSLFSQHLLWVHVQPMQTHTHKHKAFSLFPALYSPAPALFFFSICTLTCIQCSIPVCAVLPTVTDVHVFPHGLCTHHSFTIPLWHLAQVQMSWIGKRWLFPLLSLHVDLHWVGDFPAYHTHCLCFLLLIY